jgi:hypothetical protein
MFPYGDYQVSRPLLDYRPARVIYRFLQWTGFVTFLLQQYRVRSSKCLSLLGTQLGTGATRQKAKAKCSRRDDLNEGNVTHWIEPRT